MSQFIICEATSNYIVFGKPYPVDSVRQLSKIYGVKTSARRNILVTDEVAMHKVACSKETLQDVQ